VACISRWQATCHRSQASTVPSPGTDRSGTRDQHSELAGELLGHGSVAASEKVAHELGWRVPRCRPGAVAVNLRQPHVAQALPQLAVWIGFYDGRRPRSSIDRRAPEDAYFGRPPLKLAA